MRSDWPAILRALTLAIKAIWAVCCPCLGVALLISLFTRKISHDETAALEGEKLPPAPAGLPPVVALEGA